MSLFALFLFVDCSGQTDSVFFEIPEYRDDPILIPQVKSYSLKDKYGRKRNWPIWTRDDFDPSKRMNLDVLDFSSIKLDSKALKENVADLVSFEEMESHGDVRLFTNEGIFYKLEDGNLILISIDLTNFDHTVSLRGMEFSRKTTLKKISKILKKSYLWRDADPNMMKGFYDQKEWIDLTMIMVGNSSVNAKNGEKVDMHFYKGNLIYLYFL